MTNVKNYDRVGKMINSRVPCAVVYETYPGKRFMQLPGSILREAEGNARVFK